MKRAIFYLGLLTLAACADQNMNDLHDYVDEIKARPPVPLGALPEVKQPETFLYESRGRRDPFTQQRLDQPAAPLLAAGDGPQPDLNRRREELESYSLDTLRMVGTVEQEQQMWGLVQTSDGTIHRIHEGNYLGLNHGRIIRVSEDKIELMELVPSGTGGYLENAAALSMGEE